MDGEGGGVYYEKGEGFGYPPCKTVCFCFCIVSWQCAVSPMTRGDSDLVNCFLSIRRVPVLGPYSCGSEMCPLYMKYRNKKKNFKVIIL